MKGLDKHLLQSTLEEIKALTGSPGYPETFETTAAFLLLEARRKIIELDEELGEMRAELNAASPLAVSKCTTPSCMFPRWHGRELCLRCDPSPLQGAL